MLIEILCMTEEMRKCQVYFFTTRNTTLVRRCFLQHDADVILAVPIPQRDSVDRIAGTGSNNGIYSAKTGYHFLYSMKFGTVGAPHSVG